MLSLRYAIVTGMGYVEAEWRRKGPDSEGEDGVGKTEDTSYLKAF